MSKKNNKKISIALQGGGSYGAFSWGVLDALLEDDRIDIEGLSGTSAGGMNAVALVQGLMQDPHNRKKGAQKGLYNFWKKISDLSKCINKGQSWPWNFLGSINPQLCLPNMVTNRMIGSFSPYFFNAHNIEFFKKFLEDFFDIESVRQAPEHIFICATDVLSGKLKIFRNQELTTDVLMASACLPKLFQSVVIDEYTYWDGGYAGNPALFPLIDHCESHDILIIQLTNQRSDTVPQTHAEIKTRLFEINSNLSLLRELRAIHFISNLIDQRAFKKPMKRVYIHLIRPEQKNSISLDKAIFGDWSDMCKMRDEGTRIAQCWLNDNFDRIGVEDTASLLEDFVL